MSDTENQILSATNFSNDDYTFADPKTNKSGGKSVNIQNKKSKTALVLTTPLMLTWGVNEYVDDMTGKKTYDMSLQFPKEEYATPETTSFLENIIQFQEDIKKHVQNESKKLLNKAKISADVVDALCHPILRYPKDPHTGEPDMSRAPTLRIKLSYWDDNFDCEIYDMKQSPLFPNDNGTMPLDLIAKGANVATVIRSGGIWFANGKFGTTFRLVQAVVKPRANLKGRCFIQLSSAEKSRLEKQEDPVDEVNDEIVEDSDDGEADGGSAEQVVEETVAPPEPPPQPKETAAPPKKKKVVRKVKKAAASTSA